MKSKKKLWIRFVIIMAFAVLFLLFALFAGKFAPYDPLETHYTDLLKAPCKQYLMGTIAGFWGGAFDAVLMRLSDMLMAFPGSIFTIALVSFLGTGLPNLILAMTITGWTYYARISRSLVLSIKNNTYIEQARLGGANNFRIMTGYIIPNVMPSLLVNITQDIGSKLLTIAGLSLLGLGSQPPTPEWGYMLSEGKDYMYSAPWMLMAPGIVILINVIIFNLLGDSIQDLMNPKRKN